jgi:microcystin degradation protein MlrC
MKRIAVAGFQHETNTFAPTLTGYSDFEEADAWPGLLRGDDVIRGLSGVNISITGFADAAAAAGGYEIVPVLWCTAEPSSYVTTDAFEREDGEGELLHRIRDLVGQDLPIAVSFDLHANVTPEIVAHASAITIFRTYPHIDLAETGARAFMSLERLLTTGPSSAPTRTSIWRRRAHGLSCPWSAS